MVTPYGIKYAVHVITSHFGNLVAKVCETLLRKGPLTLKFINQYTQLNSRQINNSLLILIQHNCVQAFSVESEGEFGRVPKAETEYLALIDNIFHRMRFSKYLELVAEKLDKDKDCEDLLKGLLQNGRLTLQQMIERAESEKNKENDPNRTVSDVVRDSLLKLLSGRFVERCPAAEPVVSAKVIEETPARKRGAKSAKISEASMTLEQRVLAAALPLESLRFLITEFDAKEIEHLSPSMSVGQKRKRSELEHTTNEVLWRANFVEFTSCLRHKVCVDIVRSQFDEGAAVVLGALLEATRSTEKTVKIETTVPLSLNNVYEEVIKHEAGRSMTLDRVRASLVALGCSDDNRVYLRKLIEQSQKEEIEATVLKRHGRDAYRIFRLLSKDNVLFETNKIADGALVDSKETPKILYKLWKDEFLLLERVGVAKTQVLLWRINKLGLRERMLDEIYHASFNLAQRLSYEFEKESELLSIPKEKRVGTLREKHNRLFSIKVLLESSLFKLDDAVMVFHDF